MGDAPKSVRRSPVWALAGVLWTAAAAFVWIGFLFGESRDPWLFGLSRPYLAFLGVLPLVLALPVVVVWLARRLGWRRFLSEAGPTLALLLLAYLVSAGIYYQRQEHRFDPYLQAPPQRVEALEAPRRPGELRVAALGGSTTLAPTLPAQDRYPAQLRERLASAGHDIVVYNGGQNWWTTRHTLTHWVTHVRHWQPDVAIVMHAINDLYRSCSPPAYSLGEYDDLYSHFYGAAVQGARPPSFVQFLLARPLRLMDQQWYRPWRRREVDQPLSRFVSIVPYERNLRTLVHVIRDDGTLPVLMTQPSLLQPDPDPGERAVMRFGEEFCLARVSAWSAEYPSPGALRRAMDAYNAVVRRVAEQLEVPLVDLDASMPRDLEHFIDDVHYTSRGAARVADEVAAILVDRLDPSRR